MRENNTGKFLTFLASKNALDRFRTAFREYRLQGKDDTFEDVFGLYAKQMATHPEMLFRAAFPWMFTPEGQDYWYALELEWNARCSEEEIPQ